MQTRREDVEEEAQTNREQLRNAADDSFAQVIIWWTLAVAGVVIAAFVLYANAPAWPLFIAIAVCASVGYLAWRKYRNRLDALHEWERANPLDDAA